MPVYTLVCVDSKTDRVLVTEQVECNDDVDALDKAYAFDCAHDVTLWQGERRVAHVPKRPDGSGVYLRIVRRDRIARR